MNALMLRYRVWQAHRRVARHVIARSTLGGGTLTSEASPRA